MHPVLFRIPFINWPIHTYGLMIAMGFLIGMQLGAREAHRIDTSPKRDFDQFIMDLVFWILISSMVGARLLFIIVEWEADYARDPLKIFRIWEGGLVFYGGFIAAVAFSVAYARKRGRKFLLVADTLIPSVALGHFFGRLGCFAAGCCWGTEVRADFPLAVQFPAKSLAYSAMARLGHVDGNHTLPLHPVQLYESAGELTIFFLLITMRQWKRFHGQVLLTYLFLYPLLRTSLEFLRGDAARGQYHFLGTTISTSQIISVLIATGALLLLAALLHRKSRKLTTT
jgi:phosphatidylglycerol---prolipoprotein diacylglyceryl transferase